MIGDISTHQGVVGSVFPTLTGIGLLTVIKNGIGSLRQAEPPGGSGQGMQSGKFEFPRVGCTKRPWNMIPKIALHLWSVFLCCLILSYKIMSS